MRILFATQSDSLRMFDALRAELDARVGVEAAGFTVADSFAYSKWLAKKPDFEHRGHSILKEWEVTAKRAGKPRLARIAAAEVRLGGEAGLSGAIVADRRLIMGPDCSYSQDYQGALRTTSFCASLRRGSRPSSEIVRRRASRRGDRIHRGRPCSKYIVYLVGEGTRRRVGNIRPSEVADRVMLSTTLDDPDPALSRPSSERWSNIRPFRDEAGYLARVREQHGRYEGAIRPGKGTRSRSTRGEFSTGRGNPGVPQLANLSRWARSCARQPRARPPPGAGFHRL